MTEKLHIEAIIPISSHRGDDYSFEQEDMTTNEITEILNSELFDFSYLLDKAKLNIIQCEKSILDSQYKYQIENWNYYNDFFLVTTDTILNIEKYQFINNDTTEIDNDIAKAIIANDLIDIIYELFFYAHIARPGSVLISKGIVFINNIKYGETYEISRIFRDAYFYSLKLNYSVIDFCEIKIIRNWLKDNNIHSYNEPKNKLSIAINCLTYVLSPNLNDAEKLIYCMIGLESLYTKGNDKIVEQLNDKIQIYLGQLHEYKKIIKEMYSIRSKYLHGDLPIKAIFLYSNTDKNQYENEVYKALCISSMVLIKTIQKMVIEKRTEINFEYKII